MQLLMVVVNLLIRLNQSNQLATLMLPPVMSHPPTNGPIIIDSS